MAVTEAQKKATAKYKSKAYDQIQLRVYKGEREIISEHANKQGESLNAFIKRAINEQIKRDNEQI